MANNVTDHVRPLDDVVDLVGDASLVLLGEASHGTQEFYETRAELTRRLIKERGFRGMAVEADWPAAARVNQYVRSVSNDQSAEEALGDFIRFPRWMWRNEVIAELVEWLRSPDGGAGRAGFYGLDLYSLRESMHAVIDFLQKVDPDAAERARRRYACFDAFDEQAYGLATATGYKEPCEDKVVEVLTELHQRAAELSSRAREDGSLPPDAQFVAEMNAKLAVDAERYYRAMFQGRASSWNLRDTHMADTLDALRDHLDGGSLVVWAHNSHLGDARATSMGWEHGEHNVGQLMRERHGDEVRVVGFSTHTGTVTAAHDWDEPGRRYDVRPSLPGSVERLLHEAGVTEGAMHLRNIPDGMRQTRLERMIGVVYRPETERQSHYVEARPADQFDVLIHLDETSALRPLEPWAVEPTEVEPAETYPFGV
jgi:erythromycin esterase-like protein